jgi:hypothetical protein
MTDKGNFNMLYVESIVLEQKNLMIYLTRKLIKFTNIANIKICGEVLWLMKK